jgi:Nitronate monooxygenase
MNYSTQITSNVLGTMAVPIVQAPMAGGPSTPALAVAVDRAGGLGFLAAGYLSAKRLEQDISTIRAQIDRFGVNVFVAAGTPADPERVRAYAGACSRRPSAPGSGWANPGSMTTRSRTRSSSCAEGRWPRSRSRSGCRRSGRSNSSTPPGRRCG